MTATGAVIECGPEPLSQSAINGTAPPQDREAFLAGRTPQRMAGWLPVVAAMQRAGRSAPGEVELSPDATRG